MKYYQVRNSLLKIIFALLTLILTPQGYSQSKVVITKQVYQNLPWHDFLEKIEKNYNLQFFYNKSILSNFNISVKKDSITLEELLIDNLKQFNILVSFDGSSNIFLTQDTPVITKLPEDFSNVFSNDEENTEVDRLPIKDQDIFIKTSKEYITETFVIGTKEKGINKKDANIKGCVKSLKTGETIIGATIIQKADGKGVATDEFGNFQMSLKKGKHILVINSLITSEKTIEVEVLSDGNLDIMLEDKLYMLEDVVISAQAYSKVSGTQMGIEKLTVQNVKKIPLIFGEKDVLKIALLLPGVQSVGEGSAGFNVRGSPTDQNVFYINNVPIYNTSHASGFFSSFNSDAIEEFSLHKSNIPIDYGGRLASIFDIKAKVGNKNKTTASGGIGFITGRVLVEGPIKKDKSSFLVGVRSTYSDWAKNMLIKNQEVRNSKAKFSDAISNLSFQLDEKNQLNIFTYYSRDKLDLAATLTKYNYENIGASIAWNHYFNKNRNIKLSLANSSYSFDEENSEFAITSFKSSNKLQHTEFKAVYYYNPNEKHSIIFGINSILYHIDRGSRIPLSTINSVEEINFGKEKGLESSIFLGDEWKISPKFSLTGGIRYELYSYLGPQKIYEYKNGLPKVEGNIQDTLNFGNNDFIRTYGGLDFRFGARYMLNDNLSLKVSYNRLHQYIYILSNTIAVSPNYKWKLIDYNTKPMIGDQISAGLFTNILANRYEVSLEAYYKKTKNLVEIKDGADIESNRFTEQITLQGGLDAYGVELMIKKLQGNFKGWISYSYSSSSIVVNDQFDENKINFGESYPSNYDKPHNLNLVGNYNFSRRLSISGNIVYSTGRPITYPTAYYEHNGIVNLIFSKRNAYRIPDYARVDLAITLEGNLKKHKIAHGSWTFSIYNLLGRHNAYSVYFTEDYNILISGNKLSVFATPIYSLTYNFKLGNYEN